MRLLLGLAISNSVGVPSWLKGAVRTEFYIKIGLVILGASILFGDLLQAGLLGIAQALLVVTAVWFVCFRLARRLGVDDEFATMLASAVSICGVSAAIAACGAIQGDRKKLSYVTSLVLIVSAPMMVIMPHIIRTFGIPDAVGGAWLGGTLDTSASVVAAGEMISDSARDVGVVVKLSQNVLIGVAAFLLTIWWTMKDRGGVRLRPDARVIWERFPKFVLGFIAASLVLSFLIAETRVAETKGLLTGLRTLWFALAFTSIGLETRFADLVTTQGGRPALAFLGGQAFNVLWTLLLAYLLFGGMFFAVPTFGKAVAPGCQRGPSILKGVIIMRPVLVLAVAAVLGRERLCPGPDLATTRGQSALSLEMGSGRRAGRGQPHEARQRRARGSTDTHRPGDRARAGAVRVDAVAGHAPVPGAHEADHDESGIEPPRQQRGARHRRDRPGRHAVRRLQPSDDRQQHVQLFQGR